MNIFLFLFSKIGPMEPFRPLLKPFAAFHWTEELQKAFKDSKEENLPTDRLEQDKDWIPTPPENL